MDNKVPEPTKEQIALAEFGYDCERSGFKPSHYYRLWPQISQAQAIVSASKEKQK